MPKEKKIRNFLKAEAENKKQKKKNRIMISVSFF